MREMRRSERAMLPAHCHEALERAWVGRMATMGSDGPYITPLSFVFAAPATIYFHCAATGHKLDNIAHDARVCFEVDECHGLRPAQRASQCSMEYTSVLAFGRARHVEAPAEKRHALDLLVAKYALMEYPELTPAEVEGVTIIAIDIDRITGKSNRRPIGPP